VPAPLANLLSAVTSGAGVLSPELVDHFGGRDAILSALRSFDPNARLTETETSGGEGGLGPMGLRLDFDVTKAPKSKMGTLGYDLRASNFGELKNPHAVVDDANYGSVTNSANVKKPNDPLWVKLAPLLVSVAAPYAGGALAGMGIGGTAGLTAAATGSGLGGASSIPGWLASQVAKAPSYARGLANGGDPLSMLLNAALGQGAGALSGALGLDPNVLKTGLTLGQLARTSRPRAGP